MYVKELTLQQFRSYKSAHFRFDPTLTLITGQNGIGKTNLLEAVYVLFRGGSFRAPDKDLIQSESLWWRLDGVIDNEPRQVRYQLDHRPAKQLIVHDTSKRFMYKDRLPVVLFEPNDLQLISGSPTRRRTTLDTMLIALSGVYKTAIDRYERALQQRNNILKQPPHNLQDTLFSWDVLLSEYGTEIIRQRQQLIDDLNERIGGYYGHMANASHNLHLVYVPSLPANTSKYIALLQNNLRLDTLRGSTSLGPHRDDFVVELRGSDAKNSASRGEVRTIILSLKIAYAELLEEVFETKPVILLDDVLSELDTSRQEQLMGLLQKNQTIMTDTKSFSTPYQIHL